MKHLLTWIGLFLSINLLAQEVAVKDTTETHKLSLYGFARGEMFINSRENLEAMGGLICLYPLPVSYDNTGIDINGNVNGSFLAINSRVGVKYGFSNNKVTLGANIEGDFGATTNGFHVFRLRHAFVSAKYKSHYFIFGQTWHPFYDGVFPNTLTLNGGAPFAILNRSPQLRYELSANNNWTVIASFVAEANRNISPETVLGVSYKNKNWKAGLMGNYRYTNNEVHFAEKDVNRKIGVNSFAGTIYAQYTKDLFSMNARVLGGQNLSYLTKYGSTALIGKDEENLTAEFNNMNQIATYFCASYGKTWRVNLFGGYLKSLGYSKPILGTEIIGAGSNIDQIYRATASLEYNYKGLNVALETEFTGATYAALDSDMMHLKALEKDADVYNIRGVLRVTYNFSKDWTWKK